MNAINAAIKTDILEESLSYKGYRYACRIYKHPNPVTAPVLFLNGAFQTMESWKKFVEDLWPSTTVVVADLPGTGKADYLPEAFGFDYLCGTLHHLLSSIELGPAYLVSTSYATPLAYQFSYQYPEYVERLVMAGTMQNIPPLMREGIEHSIAIARQRDVRLFTETVINVLTGDLSMRNSKQYQRIAKLLEFQFRLMNDADWDKYIANTRRLLNINGMDLTRPPQCPVLIFTGELDSYTSPEHGLYIAEQIPNASFLTIKDADHLYHMQQFETTLEIIKKFGCGGRLDSIENVVAK